MKESKADLLLHPIRMRLIQTMMDGRPITSRRMGELLPDIPQATLYRHLNKLRQAGLIVVVDETPVRGTVEKVYALASDGANVTQQDLAQASREDHMRYFMTFVSGLIADYGRYLEQEHIDLEKDGVGYRQVGLHLSDEEFVQLSQSIGSILRKALENEPGPGRKQRILSTIVMPQITPKQTGGNTDEST